MSPLIPLLCAAQEHQKSFGTSRWRSCGRNLREFQSVYHLSSICGVVEFGFLWVLDLERVFVVGLCLLGTYSIFITICSIAHVASKQEIRGRFQQLLSKARRLFSRDVRVALLSCHRAIQSNPNVVVTRAFLEQREIRQNMNQRIPDKSSSTSLLHAAFLCLDGGDSIVKTLLALPEADLNLVANRDGLTPLHSACLLSRYEILELLNDRRVDVSAKIILGNWIALHCACSALLDESEFEKRSWGLSCKEVEVVRMLLKAAATKTESLLRFLNERDSRGRTALHYTSENNHRTVVEEIFTFLLLITGVRMDHSPYDAMSKATSGVNERWRAE